MKGSENIFEETDEVLSKVIEVVSSFTEDEINRKPFEGSWTPGEVTQHVIITLGGYIEQLDGPVMYTNRPFDERVPMLKEIFLNFEVKYQSPVSALPEAKNYNKEELVHNLEKLKYHLKNYDQTANMMLTCVAFEFPGGIGHLTRTENLHFLLYHTQRHLHQLTNIYKTINQLKSTNHEIY